MAQLSDLEIANLSKLKPISEIARKVGITEDALEPYGHYKAKIDINQIQEQEKKGKVVLVTAMSPTPAGEGKSTVTVGLADAFNKLNHNVTVALREPALGPTFGIKGGATGGGYAQVLPMEDINLHFNGDFMQLLLQTMHFPHLSTTTYIKEMNWELINEELNGNVF